MISEILAMASISIFIPSESTDCTVVRAGLMPEKKEA
jgi:hypothetical protein